MNCNNYFDMTDQGDSFETWQGLRGPAGPRGTPGAPGSSVELKGPVATTGDLPASAPASELWQVGTQAPYNGYFFNGTSWVNLGPVAAGTTFTPAVSSDGVISWTNDGGLPNPESVNIKGPQGATGATGADGVSPEVTIAQISGGHSVTITDADHPQGQQFNVLDGQPGQTGPGVPAGGTAGQVLTKTGPADYATGWTNAPDPSGYVSYSESQTLTAAQQAQARNNIGTISAGSIAIIESSPATQAHAAGQLIVYNGRLYKVTAAISAGESLTEGTNVEATNIANVIDTFVRTGSVTDTTNVSGNIAGPSLNDIIILSCWPDRTYNAFVIASFLSTNLAGTRYIFHCLDENGASINTESVKVNYTYIDKIGGN